MKNLIPQSYVAHHNHRRIILNRKLNDRFQVPKTQHIKTLHGPFSNCKIKFEISMNLNDISRSHEISQQTQFEKWGETQNEIS